MTETQPQEVDASTETDEQPNRESTATEPTNDTGTDPGPGLEPGSATIRRYLTWGTLAVCSLLALFALVQFYGSVTEAIDLWVDPKYRPVMRAAFNLAVLLASLVGVSVLARELN